MLKQLLLLIALFSTSMLFGQQLGDFFDVDKYAFHSGVDSIITSNYMVNQYADGDPDLMETYDGKDVALIMYDQSKLIYENKLAYTTKRYLHDELTKVESLTFNDSGQQLSYKLESFLSEGLNEAKTYLYDKKGRLVKVVRVGYHLMEYESGDSTIYTDTAFEIQYGENNLVESASALMDMGISLVVETEIKNDTVFYTAEMGMSAEMLEMMGDRGGPASKKETMMYLVENKDTGLYEAYEKGRGGKLVKQFIDKEGRTLELIESSGGEPLRHEKYGYQGVVRTSIETLPVSHDEGNTEYNKMGQLIKETTYEGTKLLEYDDQGILVKEFSVNPYTTELTDLTVHKIYYRK